MQIRTALGAYFGENSYLVRDEVKKLAILIDPGARIASFDRYLKDEKLTLTDILLTHAHVDHIAGAGYYHREYDAPIWLHKNEKDVLTNTLRQYADLLGDQAKDITPGRWFVEGDDISSLSLSAIETPGHTQGSVVFQLGEALFTGDTLFCGSIGRMDLFTGDEGQMCASLKKLFSISENRVIYPGHGETTTMENERRWNPYVRAVLEQE